MDGTTMVDISMLANYGVLGLFAAITIVSFLKISAFLGRKFFDDEKGYVVQYMRSHQKFLDSLEERDSMQQELCSKHALTLGMVETMVTGNAEKNAAELESLHVIKSAGLEHCKMCRILVRHIPDSDPAIETHLSKIEELLK